MGQLENFSLIGGERQDAIDHCLAGITRLSNEVADATGFIPAYDQRTYSQVGILPLYHLDNSLTLAGYQSSYGEATRDTLQIRPKGAVSV